MSILTFLFLLGVVSAVFDVVWNYLFLMTAISLIKGLRIDPGGVDLDKVSVVIKASSYYLLSSLFVITLYRIPDVESGLFLVNGLLGLLVLFTTLAGSSARAQAQAERDLNYIMLQYLRFDGVLIIITCVYYVAAVLFPWLARNLVTDSLFKTAVWLLDLPVIGFVVGIVAAIATLKMILAGAFTGFTLIVHAFASRKDTGS